jgi:hypothetical protein
MQNREEFRQKGHDTVGVKNDCKKYHFQKEGGDKYCFQAKI